MQAKSFHYFSFGLTAGAPNRFLTEIAAKEIALKVLPDMAEPHSTVLPAVGTPRLDDVVSAYNTDFDLKNNVRE